FLLLLLSFSLNAPATTQIYTLSLHDALPISQTQYGVDSANPHTRQFAKQCLLTRRLIERGVPFIELTTMKGVRFVAPWDDHGNIDRKSTRLNSSHVEISYAVFCLKKKKKKNK